MITKLNLQNILNISKQLNILYVEDNEIARESTYMMFKSFFNKVVVGVDGNEAIGIYKNYFDDTNGYFDIVISDINMPHLNGIDMCKAIYKINQNQKIIIVSAYSDKEYLIPLINLGVDGFMQKPLSFEQITDVVKKICQEIYDNAIVNLGEAFVYNKQSDCLFQNNEEIKLNKNEIKLFELFLKDTNEYFSLQNISNYIFYNEPYKDFSSESIRALLKRFRKKLPNNLIINDRTLGYKINLPK